jgi:hypothetical protein
MIEAMKMALEALKEINQLSVGENAICLPAEIDAAMDALRQAIGQAEQKPCLKGGQCKHGSWCSEVYCQEHCEFVEQAEQQEGTVMAEYKFQTYAAYKKDGETKIGVVPEPEQEPVAWANPHDLQNFDMKVRTNGGPLHTVPLYTTPPQRKPLTHPQIHELDWPDGVAFDEILLFVRAIEAAHGITGEIK